MSEVNNIPEIKNLLPQNVDINSLKELLKKFKDGKISNISETFNLDGNQELSETEKQILEKLKTIENIIDFLESIINDIEKKQNGNQNQETTTNIPENLKNKTLSEYSKQEAQIGLNFLNDNYKNYTDSGLPDGKINQNLKIIDIKDKHHAHLYQKELIKIIDPELFKNGFSKTHIRGFDYIKGESIITIEEFKKKLFNENTKIIGNKYDENVISYMEMSRYIRYIELMEGFELDFSDENDEKNKEILTKYIPQHLQESFLNDWKKKITRNNIYKGSWITSDEVKEGEFDIILENLTDEEENLVDLLIKDGYDIDEIKQILIKKNEKIKTQLEKYEKKYKKYYDEERIKKQEEEQKNDTKKDTNKSSDKSGPMLYASSNEYIKNQTGYILTTNSGEQINISEKEKNIAMSNPKAKENLINFYSFFKELNLIGVWKFRQELFLAIGDYFINPNDNDSIKKEELRKFGNKLLTFISNIENKGNGKKATYSNLNDINNELRKFSGSNSMLSNSKTFNIQGEDKFTAYLRSQGIIGGAYFKISKFRELTA